MNSKTGACISDKSLYVPTMCSITHISELTPTENLYRIEIPNGKDLGQKPGQFVQVSICGVGEAPISICSSPTRKGYFELSVRNVGSVTGAMHKLQVNDKIGIRGPFGNSFDTEKMQGKELILIAGGIGLAPMRSLIQYCEDHIKEFKKVTILSGAKTPDDQLFKDEVEQWRHCDELDCFCCVDADPKCTSCKGVKIGLITTLIPPLNIDIDNTIAVIVGPPVMYKFVIQELKKKGLTEDKIAVSLERYMKCGVGKCGHCTIENLYVCLDGPVFWLNEISNLRGAI